jgi:hypothetical protein
LKGSIVSLGEGYAFYDVGNQVNLGAPSDDRQTVDLHAVNVLYWKVLRYGIQRIVMNVYKPVLLIGAVCMSALSGAA